MRPTERTNSRAKAWAVASPKLLSAGIGLAQTPPEGARPEAAPPAPATATPAPPRANPPAAQPKRAAPRVVAATPECAWSGRRIVSLLMRDDVDTADKFRRFYDQFACPTEHVGLALSDWERSSPSTFEAAKNNGHQGRLIATNSDGMLDFIFKEVAKFALAHLGGRGGAVKCWTHCPHSSLIRLRRKSNVA